MRRGMLLGKFMPPHLGHVYLGEFAGHYVDELAIVVGSLAREPIPGALRFRWMQELFPFATVLHLTDELPQEPAEHPDFWRLWHDALRAILPFTPDYVFASESYGEPLAALFGATFVPVDLGRHAVPVSGTAIRREPLRYWDYLPRCVRPHYVKRVCLFGPESTGKSTLTQQLATHFRTAHVPEYARTLIERQQGQVHLADMERIARGQLAAEQALARNANRVLFCDTDPLTTTLWSEELFGTCPMAVQQLANEHTYDLYLLLDVAVPWVADIVRYRPEDRIAFMDRCRSALEQRGRRYTIIRGEDWHSRTQQAIAAVQELLADAEHVRDVSGAAVE